MGNDGGGTRDQRTVRCGLQLRQRGRCPEPRTTEPGLPGIHGHWQGLSQQDRAEQRSDDTPLRSPGGRPATKLSGRLPLVRARYLATDRKRHTPATRSARLAVTTGYRRGARRALLRPATRRVECTGSCDPCSPPRRRPTPRCSGRVPDQTRGTRTIPGQNPAQPGGSGSYRRHDVASRRSSSPASAAGLPTSVCGHHSRTLALPKLLGRRSNTGQAAIRTVPSRSDAGVFQAWHQSRPSDHRPTSAIDLMSPTILSAASVASSCSQILHTTQPAAVSLSLVSRSRSRFTAIFSAQYSALVLATVKC